MTPTPERTGKSEHADLPRLQDHARERRDRALTLASRAIAAGTPTSADNHLAEAEKWSARQQMLGDRLEQRFQRVSVAREALTYERHGECSFLRDLVTSRMRANDSEGTQAVERLQRHRREMDIEHRAREQRAERRRGEPLGTKYEGRANPSGELGRGGEFSPPLWLEELFAVAPRPERVIADLCRSFSIPERPGFSTINLPILKVGTSEKTSADDGPVPERDIETSAPKTELATISGSLETSLQLLEQSPRNASFDELVFIDMLDAYDAALESELTIGTGATERLLGILNVSGRGEITFTEASPKAVAFYPKLGEVAGFVSDNRKRRAECWLMRGGRWYGSLLATGQDEQKRPLSVPMDIQSPTAPAGPIGTLLGNVAVYLSESIPTTLGAAGNQDAIAALRPRDFLLWESPPVTTVLTDVLSGTLQARLILRAYAGFIPNRYPTSIATLGGTGLKVETNE